MVFRAHAAKLLTNSVACVFVIFAEPAWSQVTEDRQAKVPDRPEIVVTALLREQRLQEAAASISVIGAADILETGKNGFADYINSVPGLSVASGGPGLSTLAIRGITTGGVRNDEPQNKETVAVYLDDAPISVNGFNPDMGLFDIARIEVLRGPQGTLYGAGSLGGAIRIITSKPALDMTQATVEGALSATDHGGANHEMRGMINLPVIAGTAALRMVAFRSDGDGYIDNPITGANNVNDVQTYGGRIVLGVQPAANFSASLMSTLQYLRTGSRAEQTSPYQRINRAFDGLEDRAYVHSARLDYDLGSAILTSATSLLDKRNVNRISLEFLLESALGFRSASPLVDTTRVKEFTQEVRIASDDSNALGYVLGLFYQNRRRSLVQNGMVPGIDAFAGVPATALGAPQADLIFFGTQDIRQKQWAAFGELSRRLTDKLSLTAGLRFSRFREHYDTYSSGLLNGGSSASAGRFAENGMTPKFSLSFSPDREHMLYIQAAKGFRLGGVNTTVPADLCRADLERLGRTDATEGFRSDSTWNYEIGTRNQSADGRFTFNASAYYIRWHNMQLTLNLPTCGFSYRDNAGAARSIGLEVEAQARLMLQTEIFGSIGLTDARLTEDVPFTNWRKGDRTPSVAPVQVNLGLRQNFRLFGDKAAFLRIDYSYVSKAHRLFDRSDPSDRSFNGYSLVNLSAGVRPMGASFTLGLFARNLFNVRGRVMALPTGIVAPERYVTIVPRTIGAVLRAAF